MSDDVKKDLSLWHLQFMSDLLEHDEKRRVFLLFEEGQKGGGRSRKICTNFILERYFYLRFFLYTNILRPISS